MVLEKVVRTLPSLCLCCWVAMAGGASAAQIVGVTFARGLHNVDPVTGNTTQLLPGCSPPGCGPYFGGSASPGASSIYIQSVVNIWEVNLAGPQFTPVGGNSAIDLAFDRGTNTVYGTNGSALFVVSCPTPAGPCSAVQTGPGFPTDSMQALDFVPRIGLYGVGENNLYLISPSTGVASFIGFTGLSPDPLGNTNVTDLAYDQDTGRLIASVGCVKQFGAGPLGSGGPCDESNPGSIHWIDRLTGQATLLNANAPQLMGLGRVVPEPATNLPVAAALGALLFWGLRAGSKYSSSRLGKDELG